MNHKIKYSARIESSSRAIPMPEHATTSGAYWFVAGFTAMLLVGLMAALPVEAQDYDNQNYQRQNTAYITVYEDCDYRGRSRNISVGDYQNVRDIGLGNDKISSLRVPNGLEVELFEDERFRGPAVTIDRDVRCLNKEWNDQTSSLRVNNDERGQSNNRNGDYNREDRYQNRNDDYNRKNRNYNREERNQNRDNNNGDNRNKNNSDERESVDKAGSFGVVQGSCFTYKAYARGGQAGIKFQGKDIKQQFDDDAVSGRVCHSGSLTMELNKTDPNVDVFVEIQGRTYKFVKGEKEDLLLNTWYRKMIKLKVTG